MDDVLANSFVFTNDSRVRPSVERDLGEGYRSDWRYDRRCDWSYRGGRSGGRPGVVVNRVSEPENGGRLS